MGILKILFIFLLIIFPFGVIPRLEILPPVYISLFDLLLFFMAIIFILLRLFKKIKPNKLFFNKDLVIFIVFSFFSLILNLREFSFQALLISSLYAFRFVLYSFCLSAIFSSFDRNFKKRAIFYLSLSGFVFVIFGIVQYFYYPELRNLSYLGWDEHLYRIFSTFLDPNFAGSVFLLEIILLIYLLIDRWRGNWLEKIYFVTAIFFSLVSFFLTYSRSSYIAMFVLIILFLFIFKQKKFFFLFIIIFILGIFLIPKNLRSEGVRLLRTVSVGNRLEQYKNAVKIFSDHPIFGVGFNSYRYAQEKYGFLKNATEETHSGSGVPDSFLLITVTTGVVGLFLFLKFWLKILIVSGKKIENKYYLLIFFSVISVLIQSLFENIILYPFVMFWIFTVLAGQ